MASGEQSGSWGTKTNTNLGTLIEEAIAGYESIATGDANVTLTTSNGATDQARKAMLKFTGALTAIRNITVPGVSKIYVIHNGCTGFPILVKTSGGVGQYVDIGERVALYCDGSEVYRVDDVRPGYNAIINGDMNIWQRGTSFAASASGAYTADRFNTGNTGAAVYTVSRSTDVPTIAQAGRLFNYSLDVQVTTADASVAAGDTVGIFQPVEGHNWLPLAGRVTTYSFWCKAKKQEYMALYSLMVAQIVHASLNLRLALPILGSTRLLLLPPVHLLAHGTIPQELVFMWAFALWPALPFRQLRTRGRLETSAQPQAKSTRWTTPRIISARLAGSSNPALLLQ